MGNDKVSLKWSAERGVAVGSPCVAVMDLDVVVDGFSGQRRRVLRRPAERGGEVERGEAGWRRGGGGVDGSRRRSVVQGGGGAGRHGVGSSWI